MTPAFPTKWKPRRPWGSASAAGFWGFLHLEEIIQERLSREFNLDLIATAPSVVYEIYMNNGDIIHLHNPADMPDPVKIDHIEEPWIKATIFCPDDYLGAIIKLCQDRRGEQVDLSYVGARAMVVYRLPLNEVVFDFYDRLKSVSKGYASFDYTIETYRPGDLVKMSILVNSEPVDALSMLVHRDRAEMRGRGMCEKMKDLIPQHLFVIPIQAAIGGRIIARETVRALRKDVTAKCYWRRRHAHKRNFWKSRRKGKRKKMRQFGSVGNPAGKPLSPPSRWTTTRGRPPGTQSDKVDTTFGYAELRFRLNFATKQRLRARRFGLPSHSAQRTPWRRIGQARNETGQRSTGLQSLRMSV